MNLMIWARCLLVIPILLAACQKSNSPGTNGGGSGKFSVSVDSSIGAASPGHSGDTFLIRLNNPAKVAAVPVVLHVPAGGRPDQGTKVNDSTWFDTVNISQNAVPVVNVTVGGKTSAYGIAYEFLINNYWSNTLGRLAPESFCVSGDTLWVGSEHGLYYSTDDGVHFTNVPALSAAAAAYRFGDGVNGVYVSGNTIYTTVLAGLFISRDGGKTFAEHDFTVVNSPTLTTLDPLHGLFVQQDTFYVAADHGICISRDRGVTYLDDTSVLPRFAVPQGIWAQGGTIYMATIQGLAISTDGGKSFTLNTSGLGTVNNINTSFCYSVCVQNGTLYVGTGGGLSISPVNALNFRSVGTPNGMGGNAIYSIAVSGQMVCAGTNGGLSISRDGGASFINLSQANGLANNWAASVAISGSTIFVGCTDENGGNPVIPGGLTVVTPRQ